MATVVNKLLLERAELDELLRPRADVMQEEPDGEGAFAAKVGPFREYRRVVESGPPDAAGRFPTTERTEFQLTIPIWGFLFIWPYSRELRRTEDRQRQRHPVWAPPDLMDARSAHVLGLLCSAALVAGYLGTVITQTITYAADQFDSSKSAQADTLANVRVGVLIALVLVAVADRRGRRVLLIASAVGSCLVTALGALAPTMFALGATQVVARGLSTTLVMLITIVAAEEMPAGSRAYAVSVMTMTGALGAGMCLWALPLADLSPSGWRILYLIPLLGLPLMVFVGRRLPESKRFVAPHRDAPVVAGHARRFWVLALSLFLIAMFSSPATQLLNEFLRSERGFSASRISLFTMLTSTPGVIGLIIGGRVADVRGKKAIVSIGVVFGSIFVTLSFMSTGWGMWGWNLVGTIVAASAGPALSMYGPELFPTATRARANGVIQVVSVAGSFVGLRLAGRIADSADLATAMRWLLIGPVVVGVLVVTLFPETARRELEDLNPEDRPPPVLPGPL